MTQGCKHARDRPAHAAQKHSRELQERWSCVSSSAKAFACMALCWPDLRTLPQTGSRPGLVIRSNALACWQGFVQMGLSLPDLRTLLAAVAEEAAQHSLVVGELPAMPHDQVLFQGLRFWVLGSGYEDKARTQSF